MRLTSVCSKYFRSLLLVILRSLVCAGTKMVNRQMDGYKLFNNCPFNFQSLSHCELITDEGIRHLGVSSCSTEHLSVLELDNCPLITDASLDHLLSCHNLQRIELYDCQLITRAGIKRLKVSNIPLRPAEWWRLRRNCFEILSWDFLCKYQPLKSS